MFYKRLILLLSFLAGVVLALSCTKKSDYEKLLQREMGSEVRQDSLFLGYYFGMPSQEFLDHSWELNQRGIITGGTHINYKLDGLSGTVTKVFYPKFRGDLIYQLPIEVSFDSWAIWNRQYHSDKLIEELIEYYEAEYGSGFIYTKLPETGENLWVKIDGNRRITLHRMDDMKVKVDFLDLTSVETSGSVNE